MSEDKPTWVIMPGSTPDTSRTDPDSPWAADNVRTATQMQPAQAEAFRIANPEAVLPALWDVVTAAEELLPLITHRERAFVLWWEVVAARDKLICAVTRAREARP